MCWPPVLPESRVPQAPAARHQIYRLFKIENYWDILSGIDHVIDTLGAAEFDHALSVLKTGGRLASLRTGPNKAFAIRNHFSAGKRMLFTLAGAKYDAAARKQGKEYRFLFVRADGRTTTKSYRNR